MVDKSLSETYLHYTNAMGQELGETYLHIRNKIFEIACVWDQYETLFSKIERVELLNQSCGLLTLNIQRTFLEHVLMGMCRLTDPPKSANRENLTLNRLPKLVKTSISTKLNALIDKAKISTDFCRDWRNRRIAHNDLDLSLNEKAKPLEAASRIKVTHAIKCIFNVVAFLELEYCETELWLIATGNDSAISLLFDIFDGARKQEEDHANASKNGIFAADGYPSWLYDDMNFGLRYK